MEGSKIVKLVLAVIVVLLGGYFVSMLDVFKSEPMKMETFLYINPTTSVPIADKVAWNPERRIALEVESSKKIKSYKIKATTEGNVVILEKEETIINRPESLKIWLPKPDIDLPNGSKIRYEIAVSDWSNANFFSGATFTKTIDFVINTKAPNIEILAHSYAISYGGSALVVFSVDSIGIKEITISNGTNTFIPFSFIKDGYYAAIVAWPIANQSFICRIQATDTAFNTQRATIPFIKNTSPRYLDSTITLQEDFLAQKMDSLIAEVREIYPDSEFEEFNTNFEKFVYINEQIRLKDEETITNALQEYDKHYASTFSSPTSWKKFVPLKGYAVVGRFGDKRTYVNDKGQTSQSIHLGLDIASVKNDNILAPNSGKIIMERKLGVYGNTAILYHGFGLASLYAHLDSFVAPQDGVLDMGDVVGISGQSGWAFGDHVHFGMLVQGQNVRNTEWLDERWIKNNITDIFENAKRAIESKE